MDVPVTQNRSGDMRAKLGDQQYYDAILTPMSASATALCTPSAVMRFPRRQKNLQAGPEEIPFRV